MASEVAVEFAPQLVDVESFGKVVSIQIADITAVMLERSESVRSTLTILVLNSVLVDVRTKDAEQIFNNLRQHGIPEVPAFRLI